MALPQPNPNSSDVQLKDVLGSFIEIAAQKTEFDQTQMALVGSKNPGGEKESVKGSILKLDEHGEYLSDVGQTDTFEEMLSMVKSSE